MTNALKCVLRSAMVFAAAQFIVNCSGDNDFGKTSGTAVQTISAYQPNYGKGSVARAGFDSEGVGYWQQGDAISVLPMSNSTVQNSQFTISSGVGEAKATFSGKCELGQINLAFYPYSEKHKIGEGTTQGEMINYYLPDSYTYDGVDQAYSEVGGKSFNMPMQGNVTETDGENTVKFVNVGGVLAVKVDRLPSAKGTLTVTADKNICGYAHFQYGDSDTPYMLTPDGGKTVTFSYSNAEAFHAGVFYLPLAPSDYTLTVKVSGEGSNGDIVYSVENRNVTIQRGHIKPLAIATDYSKTVNGHKLIDLGLQSGLLWAETNIGAESVTDFGNYYSWGETATKETYTNATYAYSSTDGGFSKYNEADGKTVLDPGDDVASKVWGGDFFMPTIDAVQEFFDKNSCTVSSVNKTTADNTTVSGYEITSVRNGNSIFLPSAGCQEGDSIKYQNQSCAYWTSTLSKDSKAEEYMKVEKCGLAYLLAIGDDMDDKTSKVYGFNERYFGFPVRPVAKP